jgi:hypothetical protein
MKTNITYSLLAAAAACSLANAQTTAYTTPVGYETVAVASGFNYHGLRLHQAAVAAGTFETVGGSSVTDTGADFSALSSNPTATFVIEITDGAGVLTQVLGSTVSGSTINTTDNLSAAGVANGANYRIRPASTLSSVFGANNSAGLAAGFGGIGGDIIFIPDGAGGFDQYYYDDLEGSWADVNGAPVNGATIPLVYTDTLIISATGSLNLVVTGEVKTKKTLAATASGFNYLGSVYPVGATLASTFDSAIPDLDKGFGGIGGDIFFVPDGSGGFNQFYYDDLESSWADVNGAAIDGSTIQMKPGVIFSNDGAPMNLKLTPPASYLNL